MEDMNVVILHAVILCYIIKIIIVLLKTINLQEPPPHEFPEYSIAFKEFNNKKSNRVPPTPNHRNFLPIIEGETIETIQCAQAINQN